MSIRNLIKNILQEESKKLKLFALDWDDNILRMPTKLYLKTDDGESVGMSTEDFAIYREKIGKEPFEFEGKTIVGLDDNAFRDFTSSESFLVDTEKAIRRNRTSPSFTSFKKALIKASPFSIITARGHDPEVIKQGVKRFIELVLSPEDKNRMIQNIKRNFKFEDIGDFYKIDSNDDEQIIDIFLDEKGEYYPVSSKEFGRRFKLDSAKGASSPEQSKKIALSDFLERVYEKVGHLIDSGKYGSVSLGFSDDDPGNVRSMISHIQNELSMMYPEIKFIVKDTSEGGMRKLIIKRERELNKDLNENYIINKIKKELYKTR
jgi:hypothetical protein